MKNLDKTKLLLFHQLSIIFFFESYFQLQPKQQVVNKKLQPFYHFLGNVIKCAQGRLFNSDLPDKTEHPKTFEIQEPIARMTTESTHFRCMHHGT